MAVKIYCQISVEYLSPLTQKHSIIPPKIIKNQAILILNFHSHEALN